MGPGDGRAIPARGGGYLIPPRLLLWLAEHVCRLRRITRDNANPYLDRYYLLGNAKSRWFLALHRIHRSDSDPHRHSHPFSWLGLMLAGFYYEDQPDGVHKRRPGYLRVRSHRSLHKLILPRGEVWTLFLGGPRKSKRSWGFFVDGRIIDWRRYLP